MSNGAETKRDKFKRLAENRTNKIINMVNLLGNLSNKSTYDYTESEVDKIFTAIEDSLREAKKKYNKSETSKNKKFKLD